MTGWPLPTSYPITTPYGKRGGSWSCDEDSSGNGVHTGADFACPTGTALYATIAGDIRHRSYGSAFGSKQFAISPDPGEPFGDGEVFYAHCSERLADGTRVEVGDYVGRSGAEGNVTGPHLHYEFHPHSKAAWTCSVHADPAPTLEQETTVTVTNDDYWYSGKPSGTLIFGDYYKRLDVDKWAPSADGLILSMLYLNVKGEGEFRVRLCRDPDDYTAYQTCYAKSGDSFLLTHVWFEWAEKGRALWWEVGAPDSGYTMEIGTRYAKFAMIR